MKETKQKIDGAYMTPQDIVDKMIDFTPVEWFKGNILEPTAGTGNIVNAILNKKVQIGMIPQEAIDTTFANEFDVGRYKELLHRIELWCEYAGAKVNYNNITNQNARSMSMGDLDYKVITNLPFGSWGNAILPRQIINNLNKPAVYLTKWSTGCNQKFCKSVIKFENIEFPGIVYDCLLWQYDPNVVFDEPQVWLYWPIPRFPKHKLKKRYTKREEC